MSAETERHGPLLVQLGLTVPAGFFCKCCRQPVRILRQPVPFLMARVCVYACQCGPGVTVWEDERHPTRKSWRHTMQMAKEAGAGMLILKGDRPTPPEFSGMN